METPKIPVGRSLIVFSDFELIRTVFEIKYENAYEHWDSAGKLWRTISDKYKNLQYLNVVPDKTEFVVDDKYQLLVSLNRASIISHRRGANINEFVELSEYFMNRVTNYLSIQQFNRVGFRTFFSKEFPSEYDASQAMLGLNLLHIPEKAVFGIDSAKYYSPSYIIRRENDNFSVRIEVSVNSKKIESTPPFEVAHKLGKEKIEINELVFDFDYVLRKNVFPSQINFSTWINEAYSVIKKDFSKINN